MMNNRKTNGVFVPSATFTVVRSLQLEGTFPGKSLQGCWPIVPLRVRRGWGEVSEEFWPSAALDSWPPVEPPGLDLLAKENRLFRYQRVRTAQECLEAIRKRRPVTASFEITQQWFDAKDGIIPLPEENAELIGSHDVAIVGADQRLGILPGSERNLFIFENSWGPDWGWNGRGFLPPDFFSRWLVEAWTIDYIGPEKSEPNETYRILPGIIGDLQFIKEINDPKTDDRIAWTFVSRRQDFLDVEELFVKPIYRGKGYGTSLLASLKKLSAEQGLPLRFLIPYADCGEPNLATFGKMLNRIGYRVEPSTMRSVPYLGDLSPSLNFQPHFPPKPTLARPGFDFGTKPPKQPVEKETAFDPNFEKAAESVFQQHEELFRRLA